MVSSDRESCMHYFYMFMCCVWMSVHCSSVVISLAVPPQFSRFAFLIGCFVVHKFTCCCHLQSHVLPSL